MTYRPHVVAVLLATAGVHLALIPEHLEEAPVLGWLFAASVVVSLAAAGAVAGAPTPRAFHAAAAVLATFALAYAYTRVASLDALGIPHESPEPLGHCTVALELLGAAFALSASRRERPAPRPAT
jgi:hypothetical protein